MRYFRLPLIRLSLAVSLSLISACSSLRSASNGEPENRALTETDESVTKSTGDNQTLGALADTQLPDRSCGMILWTLDAKRPSPVFRYVAGKEAEIVINDVPVILTRSSASGDNSFGVYQFQEFVSEDGFRLEVSSQFGVGFDGGAYLERGLVKVHAPDGWSIVAPAAGIAGCRS